MFNLIHRQMKTLENVNILFWIHVIRRNLWKHMHIYITYNVKIKSSQRKILLCNNAEFIEKKH